MELSARIVEHELAERLTIARGFEDVARLVEVEIRHEGVSGHGAATPLEHYHESPESAQAYAEGVAGDLGDDPFALEEIMRRLPAEQFAARAAIDGALARSLRQAGRPAGLAPPRSRAPRAADVLHDQPREPRRDGAAGGTASTRADGSGG